MIRLIIFFCLVLIGNALFAEKYDLIDFEKGINKQLVKDSFVDANNIVIANYRRNIIYVIFKKRNTYYEYCYHYGQSDDKIDTTYFRKINIRHKKKFWKNQFNNCQGTIMRDSQLSNNTNDLVLYISKKINNIQCSRFYFCVLANQKCPDIDVKPYIDIIVYILMNNKH